MKAEFDGTAEAAAAPRPYEGVVVHNMAKKINVVLGKNHPLTVKKTPKGQVFKKKSVFWKLPYWEILRVRHCINVMHVEKNVCESILGTLLKIKGKRKDGDGSRLDMLADQSKRKSEAEDDDKFIKARQSYNFSTKEATQFFTYLLSVKTPSSYSANIRSLVDVSSGKMKLGHMKSHDCHVMLTQILPVAIRNLMDKDIRNTLIDLCDFFNQLWQKVVNPKELDHMQDDIARILSNLEMFFPSSFFDVMVHITIHLLNEIKYCGPMFLCNMYPFKQFIGIIKWYYWNRNHPKASILQGYTTEEVVEFCTEYMKQRPIGLPLSRHEGRLKGKPVLAGTQMAAPGELAEKAHLTVLLNSPVLSAYAEEHLAEIYQSCLPMVPSSEVEMKEHTKKYAE